MLHKLLLPLLLLAGLHVSSQNNYWQQNVDYKINVSLDDKAHTLTGDITIGYTNNSPQPLEFIWFHLWPNAYKNESTAYYKQISRDSAALVQWKAMK
ncbi:MAG: hypothetical protein EOO88_54120, partial [Pedobacter sp.]